MSGQAVNLQENKMGVMPINRLLITMSLPMILSMMIQALYNVVDSIFVAQLNENALAAVSLAFPIQNLMIAVAGGTSVGVNALLSRSLGEKDSVNVHKSANNGIFLAFLSYIAFAVFGILCSRIFLRMQTDIEEIINYGTLYLSICTVASFGLFGEIMFERLLQSTGKTIYTLITQGTGAILNIIFDPILIFGLLGFPKMGIAGAAVATVFGQIVAMLMTFYFNMTKNKDVELTFKSFRPDKQIIKRIYSVGAPSIFMIAISSVMIFGINKILIAFTSTATAVFGVYFRLQSFIFMPVFGLNQGMVPIIAYNYGAGHKERIVKTIKLSITYAVCMMLAGLVIFQTLPNELLGLFNASPEMLRIGIYALRIISINFLFAGFCIITISVFQALGNGLMSLEVSITRQLVVLLPAAFFLAKIGGLDYVWWAFPIAEISSVVLCAIFLKRIYHQKIKYVGDKRILKNVCDETVCPT